MKRLVAIILVLIMSMSLCACGKSSKVKEEAEKEKLIAKAEELLQGTWSIPAGDAGLATAEYTFKNGELSCTLIAMGIPLEPQKGKYIIDESAIKIIYSSENEYIINYTIENDTLILTDPDKGTIFERVEVKPASEITEEDIEYVAMKEVYSYLSAVYGKFYDVSATRYKVGKITPNGESGYNVKGSLSLYDDYGNFDENATFEIDVVFDSIGRLTAELPKIKIDY